jgi:hypothetical protein
MCLPGLRHDWREDTLPSGVQQRRCMHCRRIQFWLLPWRYLLGEWW